MASTFNFTGQGLQLTWGLCQSVVYTPYASVDDRTEVPIAQSHYLVCNLFSGRNGSGTDFGRNSIDISHQTVLEAYNKQDIQSLVVDRFPPPAPGN